MQSTENLRVQALCAAVGGPILALDSSTMVTSLCLATPDAVMETAVQGPAMPSESLAPALAELLERHRLQPAQLAAMVVGLGPGSFTGLRVGLATLKGLALGGDISLFGTSSLGILAASAAKAYEARYVAPILDARRGEVFFGLYEILPEGGTLCHLPDGAYSADEVAERLAAFANAQGSRIELVGAMARPVAERLAWECRSLPPPRALFGIAAEEDRLRSKQSDDIVSLAPRYLRASEAERQLAAAKP